MPAFPMRETDGSFEEHNIKDKRITRLLSFRCCRGNEHTVSTCGRQYLPSPNHWVAAPPQRSSLHYKVGTGMRTEPQAIIKAFVAKTGWESYVVCA